MIRTAIALCVLVGVLSPATAQKEDGKKKDIRPLLVKLMKAKKEDQPGIIKKEIKPVGDVGVAPIQAIMDQLIPCYKKARKAFDKAKRTKKDVADMKLEEVRTLMIEVIQGGKPAAKLSTAEAYKQTLPLLGIINAARGTLVRPKVVDFIKEQGKLGVRFPGQYKPLKDKYGRAAMAIFLQMAMNSEGTNGLRSVALAALRDVAEKGEPAVMKNLRTIEADEYQSRDLRINAAITLAVLGEDSLMGPHFEKALKLTKKSNPKAQARGWKKMGFYWHEMREYGNAAKNYSEWIKIIRKLVEKNDRNNFDLSAALYRRACVYAMGGEVEKGIADIAEAVKFKGVSKRALENDKELEKLHKSPKWDGLVEKAPEKVHRR